MSDSSTNREQRWLLIAVALSVSIGFIDFNAVSVALPSIQREFDSSSTGVQWTITGYAVAGTALIAAGGRIADIFGPRRVYLGGTAMFAVSSVLCGTALADWWLVSGRVVQGAAAALLGPAGITLIAASFPLDRRGRALGTVAAASTVALAVGPLAGGIITQEFGWRWIFLINLPLAVLVIGLVRKVATRAPGQRAQRIDVAGLLLLTGGVVASVIALTKLPDWGLSAPITIALFGLGGLLLVRFVVVEHRVDEPLVHPEILRHRQVLTASTLGFCAHFVIVALTVYGLVYFQVISGLTPLEAALLLLPTVVPQLFIARRAGQLADTIGPVLPITVGMSAVAVALVWLSLVAEGGSYFAIVPALTLFGAGVALVDTPIWHLTLGVAEHHHGLSAGITSTLRRLGTTLGVAAAGAVIVASLNSRGLDLLAQRGIPVDGDDRAALQSLVVDGNRGFRELRESHHPREVEHAADAAFSYAFANGMRLAAAVALIAAIVCFVFVRREPRRRPNGRHNAAKDVLARSSPPLQRS